MDGPTFYEKISIKSAKSGKEWDITLGVLSLDFFEDILKPAVTCNVTFLDVADKDGKTAFKDLPITEGSQIYIKVKTPLNGEFEIQYDDLYLYRKGKVERDGKTQKVSLSFTSREVLKNFSIQVMPRFQGTISSTVETLMTDYLETAKTLDIEATQGENAVQGLARRVIMNDNDNKEPPIIADLARKAIPASGDEANAGYLFYESFQGYHFKSIDTLLQQESVGKFTYTNVPRASVYRDNSKVIMKADFEQSGNNVVSQASSGGSGGKKTVLNFATSTVETQDASLSTVTNASENEFVPKELEETIKPVCVIGEFANHQTDPKYKGETQSANYNKSWELSSKNRYASIFGSQVLNVTIPGNPGVKVGDIMEIEIPDLDNLGCQKEADEQVSGNYLVKELCHSFGKASCLTSIKVLRNGYGR
jgi:hypothetical protein